LFNSLRDTHTTDSVHRDSVFVYNAHKHCRSCAQGLVFVYYSARCTELLIMCTGTALLPTSARDCIRLSMSLCSVFSFQNLCDAQKGADYVHRDSVCAR